MYAPYLPSSASEFPNDNPELHEGARWVCPQPTGSARAVLRASPALALAAAQQPEARWSQVVPPVRCLRSPVTAAPAPVASEPPPGGTLVREPFALEPDAAPASRPPSVPARAAAPSATPLPSLPPGPLQLDLSRIVLPHRVADVPPPPPFIFQPLRSSRRAAAVQALARAAPPLTPLGYLVIDRRDASSRVQRRWRVDVAPCLAVAAVPELAVPELAVPELAVPELAVPELAVPAVVAPPDGLAAPEPLPVVVLPPPGPEPLAPAPEQSPASGRRRKPPSEPPAESSGKKQRRRAVRVASSASLMTAALPGNEELSRTLSALEADFAERRIEQPAAARKRRGRRGAASGGARARRAANAV